MNTLILFSLTDITLHWQHWLMVLFIGAVAGMLAEFLVGSRGFGMLVTIIIGIAGAVIGSLLFQKYLGFITNPLLNKIASATLGAIVLVIIICLFPKARAKDKTKYRA